MAEREIAGRSDLKILLVDDSDIFLKIVSSMLKKKGFAQVECMMSGLEALSFYESYDPDVIVMDTCMPGLFGFKVCREIRKNEKYSRLRILGMSDMNYHDEWMEAGADQFIMKNRIFEGNELIDQLDLLISETGH